jgi:hypothetical protein
VLFCSLSLAWKNELFSVADFANPTLALQFIFALANWRALLLLPLRFALQILIEIYAHARSRRRRLSALIVVERIKSHCCDDISNSRVMREAGARKKATRIALRSGG